MRTVARGEFPTRNFGLCAMAILASCQPPDGCLHDCKAMQGRLGVREWCVMAIWGRGADSAMAGDSQQPWWKFGVDLRAGDLQRPWWKFGGLRASHLFMPKIAKIWTNIIFSYYYKKDLSRN